MVVRNLWYARADGLVRTPPNSGGRTTTGMRPSGAHLRFQSGLPNATADGCRYAADQALLGHSLIPTP